MNAGPPWPQALLELLLCSGIPTQFFVAGSLALIGWHPGATGQLTLPFLLTLLGIDTVLLVGLVVTLLRLGGESPHAVLLGQRPIAPEVIRGLVAFLAVLLLVALTTIAIVRWVPGLITPNPLATLASTRAGFVLYAIAGIVGGGVREEIQRAFIVHRCEQCLGGTIGAIVAVVGWGVLFGILHYLQGGAAMIVTGVLGTFWNILYVVRRSIVAPMVSHASFNLIEVIGFGLST
jgi:membrane protease YdiL (CAAX protease family)